MQPCICQGAGAQTKAGKVAALWRAGAFSGFGAYIAAPGGYINIEAVGGYIRPLAA